MAKYQSMSPDFVAAVETIAMSMYSTEKGKNDPAWSKATLTVRNSYRTLASDMVAEAMKMV